MSARPHATAAARSASRARSWVRSSIVVMAALSPPPAGRSTGEGLRVPVVPATPGGGSGRQIALEPEVAAAGDLLRLDDRGGGRLVERERLAQHLRAQEPHTPGARRRGAPLELAEQAAAVAAA